MSNRNKPRETNQTKNILNNLPGIQHQPYITWK